LPRFENKLTSVTEVRHPKPAPDVYLLAAQRFHTLPRHCVVVEDSPTGVTAAVAAGMTVLGYCELTPPATLLAAGVHKTFNSMQELPRLVDP
jgi:beta-phosphoglucomutase-like phosphatase (HAD superfamily)